MRRVITIIAVLSLVSTSVCLGAFGDPPSWDIKPFDFGTDNSRTFLATMGAKGGTRPTETIAADSTNLAYAIYGGDNSGFNVAADYTAEFRAKGQDSLYWTEELRTWSAGVKIRFKGDGTEDFLCVSGSSVAAFDIDRTAWHTYRIVFDTTGAAGEVNGTASLYIDGNAPAVATVDITSEFEGGAWSVQYWIQEGGLAQGFGNMDLDYFLMATGAYHIPEPVTLALLAMGGVLALVRRRR